MTRPEFCRTASRLVATLTFAAAMLAQPVAAQNESATAFVSPCESAPFTDFDFWVGDWVAFDSASGVVQGIDRIEKAVEGCALSQDWHQMTDRYRSPGAPERYSGRSLSSVLPDGRWQQVWVGYDGGTITLQGGLDLEAGGMVMRQEGVRPGGASWERRWHWVPQEDGTIHSWGENRTLDASSAWSAPQVVWDLRYVRRSAVGALVEQPAAD